MEESRLRSLRSSILSVVVAAVAAACGEGGPAAAPPTGAALSIVDSESGQPIAAGRAGVRRGNELTEVPWPGSPGAATPGEGEIVAHAMGYDLYSAPVGQSRDVLVRMKRSTRQMRLLRTVRVGKTSLKLIVGRGIKGLSKDGGLFLYLREERPWAAGEQLSIAVPDGLTTRLSISSKDGIFLSPQMIDLTEPRDVLVDAVPTGEVVLSVSAVGGDRPPRVTRAVAVADCTSAAPWPSSVVDDFYMWNSSGRFVADSDGSQVTIRRVPREVPLIVLVTTDRGAASWRREAGVDRGSVEVGRRARVRVVRVGGAAVDAPLKLVPGHLDIEAVNVALRDEAFSQMVTALGHSADRAAGVALPDAAEYTAVSSEQGIAYLRREDEETLAAGDWEPGRVVIRSKADPAPADAGPVLIELWPRWLGSGGVLRGRSDAPYARTASLAGETLIGGIPFGDYDLRVRLAGAPSGDESPLSDLLTLSARDPTHEVTVELGGSRGARDQGRSR